MLIGSSPTDMRSLRVVTCGLHMSYKGQARLYGCHYDSCMSYVQYRAQRAQSHRLSSAQKTEQGIGMESKAKAHLVYVPTL